MEVGRRLSEARQRRNLTLGDIARRTKIPIHFLLAIERDDVDHMPPGFFARAFVRTYALEVGVNPGELLASSEPAAAAECEAEAPVPLQSEDAPVPARSWRFAVPLVAPCALCVLYYVGVDAPRAATSKAPPIAAPETPSARVERLEQAANTHQRAASDVELHIASRNGCIVAVTADGRTISPAATPGVPVVLTARGEVVLRLGDGAVCAPAVNTAHAPNAAPRPQGDASRRTPVAIARVPTRVTKQEAATPVADPPAGASEPMPEESAQPAPPPATGSF